MLIKPASKASKDNDRNTEPFDDGNVEFGGESSSVKSSEKAETKIDTIQKIIESNKFHCLYALLIVQSHFVDNGIFQSFRAV
jgi:hypothetical protein